MTPAPSIQPGDVLDMAVGPSLVLRVTPTHGGVECLVCSEGGSASRYLWFWAVQSVRVLRRAPQKAARIVGERRAKASALRSRAADPRHSESKPGGEP